MPVLLVMVLDNDEVSLRSNDEVLPSSAEVDESALN